MSIGTKTKFGKKLPADGYQLVWNSVSLASGGLTAMLLPAGGISGGDPTYWADVYGVSLSSSDTVTQAVTLSDGVSSVTWQVGSSPNNDDALTPYRFQLANPLVVSAGAVTGGKTINVAVRGVISKT